MVNRVMVGAECEIKPANALAGNYRRHTFKYVSSRLQVLSIEFLKLFYMCVTLYSTRPVFGP